MKELVVQSKPPVIEANFSEVAAALDSELSKYRGIVLTEDTVKDGKNMAAELNKIKQKIKEAEKLALSSINERVGTFKNEVKTLIEKVDETRDEIYAQVKRYEAERLETIKDKIQEYTKAKIAEAGLLDNFSTIDTTSLVKLTAVTKAGSLTGSTQSAIDNMVAIQKERQDAYLENERLRKEAEEARIREEVAKREEKIRREAEESAKREAEERAKREAEEKAKREAEEKIRREAKERVKRGESGIVAIRMRVDTHGRSNKDVLHIVEKWIAAQCPQINEKIITMEIV